MKRYKCTVAYVGANYDGWQSQTKGTSIQEKIEEALARIGHEKIRIVGSGRTDAGVNAYGQVFHFDSDMDLSPRKWQGAINGFLPKDIHILQVEEVTHRFHARHCVKEKEYVYRINRGEYDVFEKDTAYHFPYALDIQKMEEAAECFLGEHDFNSFNASTLEDYPNQVRTIKRIHFEEKDNILTISFVGKGFLRYMVRMLVAALLEVGKGKLSKKDIENILDKKSKEAFAKNAMAQGLFLKEVRYFEILALNEAGMIREFLSDEEIPKEAKNKDSYALTTRHSQEILGYLIMNEDKQEIYTFNDKGISIAESLLEDLKEYLMLKKKSGNIEIKN